MAQILVLGGGFGGLAAATTLRSLLDNHHRIVLVDQRDEFYMGFAKLWDLAGIRPLADGTRSLRNLENLGIEFLQATITGIDGENRQVRTTDGTHEADALVVALGAGPAPRHAAMLAGPGAHDLYDGAAVAAIRSDLQELAGGRVVVSVLGGPYKCPPAPFEGALIVDQLLRNQGTRGDVEVVMTTPKAITLPVAGVDASAYVADRLADHGIVLLPEHVVTGVNGSDRTIAFANGATEPYDVLLGVPANVAPPVITTSDLVGESGWIEPDRHTMQTRFDHVYAVGDCVSIPTATGELPMAGVFAAACGEVAARNVAAGLGVGEPARYDGHGYCFLELPGERVAFVEGDFYADPPDVSLTEADEEQFRRKQAYEAERLDAWLP
jgi:sulfide:quinone oxidoreductase